MPKRLIIWSDVPTQWFKFSTKGPAESAAQSGDLVEQVTSIANLSALFKRLLEANETLSELRVHTHMCPGGIALGGEILDCNKLREQFSGFARLFAANARIDLTGCNVADTPMGELFLVACGSNLLNRGGGSVIGNTGLGFANIITGSVPHPFGTDVTATVTPGGNVTLSGHNFLVPANINEGIQSARVRLSKLEAKNEKDLDPIRTALKDAADLVGGPTDHWPLYQACVKLTTANEGLKAKEGLFSFLSF